MDLVGEYEDVLNQNRTIIVGVVSYTILVWDHILTFNDEVQYVWKQSKGPIVYLFFFTRYLVPLSFMVNLCAYLSPKWTEPICDRFVRYEGVMHAAQIYLVAFMMMLRIRALYREKWWISWFLTGFIVCEICFSSFLLVHGQAVVHRPNSGVDACTMIFDESISVFVASLFAWLPLAYDTMILGLTLYRTIPSMRQDHKGIILSRLFADGILFYTVIFSLAFSFALMIIFAPPGLKNITGQATQLLTVAMMSRITLHLKKLSCRTRTVVYNGQTGKIEVFSPSSIENKSGASRSIHFSDAIPGNPIMDDDDSISELVPEGQKVRRLSIALREYRKVLHESAKESDFVKNEYPV